MVPREFLNGGFLNGEFLNVGEAPTRVSDYAERVSDYAGASFRMENPLNFRMDSF